MDMHRPGDVLDLLLAHVFERKGELVAHLIAHDPADADPARLGQSFQPCRYIDTVTVDIATVFDDVANIDPDAELEAAIGRHIGVSLRHLALHVDGTTHRVDDAGEFDQEPVAGGFADAPAVLFDLRIALRAASVPYSSAPISRL